jgi:hypothetical protein
VPVANKGADEERGQPNDVHHLNAGCMGSVAVAACVVRKMAAYAYARASERKMQGRARARVHCKRMYH